MNIPKGHQAVMPYLMIEDAVGFIDFIKRVFNAEMTHQDVRGDIVGHCEANIGGSTIMFSQSRDQWKPATANMFVYVEDADETYKKALDAGATSVMEMADQDYGRSGGVTDPHGNVWWITSVSEIGE
ncbi:MAG: VOC family protein [Acidobacteria bacterium]|nr:VOC family protein [Acidobacteriota bacterium]